MEVSQAGNSSRSSSEAEYIAAGEIAQEVQYFCGLAPQMGLPPSCVSVGLDNRAAKYLIEAARI